MYKTKAETSAIPPGNLMPMSIFYQIILALGESALLGIFKLGDKSFGFYGVDAKYLECRYDEDLILYNRHEF